MSHLDDLGSFLSQEIDRLLALQEEVDFLDFEDALHGDDNVVHELTNVLRLQHLADGLRVADEVLNLQL